MKNHHSSPNISQKHYTHTVWLSSFVTELPVLLSRLSGWAWLPRWLPCRRSGAGLVSGSGPCGIPSCPAAPSVCRLMMGSSSCPTATQINMLDGKALFIFEWVCFLQDPFQTRGLTVWKCMSNKRNLRLTDRPSGCRNCMWCIYSTNNDASQLWFHLVSNDSDSHFHIHTVLLVLAVIVKHRASSHICTLGTISIRDNVQYSI